MHDIALASRSEHAARCCLRDPESSTNVQVDNEVEGIGIDINEGLWPIAAGIVNQNVDAVIVTIDAFGKSSYLRQRPDISLDKIKITIPGFCNDFVFSGLTVRRIKIDSDDMHARLGSSHGR